MTTKLPADPLGLSKDQLDLIQQFEADYNAVDHFLRKSLGIRKHAPFRHLVDEYSRKHTSWRDADLLVKVAEVRNVLVHSKTAPYRYVAVPTSALVRDLKACRERLINPARAIPTFQRKVTTVSINDSLDSVLRIIRQCDFSQFPVYESQRFLGLLTENGITRWLALHVSTKLSLVEMDEIFVREVLQNEEERINYLFVSRDTPVDEVRVLFGSHEMLEAVLVTASGRKSEKLLGIATRWDIIQCT
jgi:predicted transcriptional regulator